ncbi:DUF3558 domain-containing protein [Rhodococcus sp. D2-41]|uniref:DUF3558 domain-containing protein n=1 Tax=Speluncibacter jeojiensis TaxID=2710754 RepID=A0A9X4M2Y8_9ACTN|nr:DUF3558 domain-containing protein [Rhodococcus sp. D2-41]MDG3011279.1 DUF3558 domain-containing protein [Rhodococcus sp. D2-41]MDG3015869.1 DUF3558 domain-containing protein [Corynebacteriales bacterium D3-21]
MTYRPTIAVAVLTTMMATAGCSASNPPAAESSSPASVLPMPTNTPRITDDSTRPQVGFDPCADLSDGQIRQLGYQPDTRRKTDYPAQDYTFLSCSFKSTDYLISISSGNITFDEEVKKESGNATSAPTTIDGRRALTIPHDQACSLAMQTTYGMVILTRQTSSFGTKTSAPPCEGIEDTARMISQFMPKGA